jgi:hypothetical protein
MINNNKEAKMIYKRFLTVDRIIMMTILFVLLLFGCLRSQSPKTTSIIPEITIATSETYIINNLPFTSTYKTISLTPQKFNTPNLETIIPSSTYMHINTPIPPSQTLMPTIAPDQRQQYVLDLLKNNANCQLPCWWGFNPGITQWTDVNNFYSSIGLDPEKNKNTFLYKVHLNIQNINIATVYIINNGVIVAISTGGVQSKDHKITLGEADYLEVFANYLLPKILSDFGMPQEIWARTFPGAPEGGPIPFYILLNYFKRGISIIYNGFIQDLGDHYSMCPQRAGIDLFIWSPEVSDPIIVADLRDNAFIRQDDFSRFLQLYEATGWSIEEFYQTFKNPQNQLCLTTKPDIWLP